MSYKCCICQLNEVDNPGDVCELCSISQDPYISNLSKEMGLEHQNSLMVNSSDVYISSHCKSRKILLNGGDSLNDIGVIKSKVSNEQIYSTEAVAQPISEDDTGDIEQLKSKNIMIPISAGITKNIVVDTQQRSVLYKWVRALFTRIPFTFDDEVTMFQVFPDYSGNAFNSLGNACDQVIVYGKLNKGVISENNNVEIFGSRDTDNNVIAKTIKNKASGTNIIPTRTLSTGMVWLITICIVLLCVVIVQMIGAVGIIWALITVLCLMNLPVILKIIAFLFGIIFTLIRKK